MGRQSWTPWPAHRSGFFLFGHFEQQKVHFFGSALQKVATKHVEASFRDF